MSNATELLRRALDYIDQYDSKGLEVYEEIEVYLAAEPEAEPVAWLIPGTVTFDASLAKANGSMSAPLYLHPPRFSPARKPMTEEEIDIGFNPYRMRWLADDQYFVAGVRLAEKHHGISGEDQ